ncbi:hypothetical protein ES705_36455 [subsurface metagenome]
MDYKSIHFIGEKVEVQFNKPPLHEKKPGCPDGFFWQDQFYPVIEKISEWQDYNRTGRMAFNMRPANAAKAKKRGSWGVGRFYFRFRTGNGQVFDIYYDRAPKNVDNRKGAWFLYREMEEIEG